MRHPKTIGHAARLLAAALALACGATDAPAQDANTNYRPAQHDPFVKPKPVVRTKKEVAKAKPKPAPTLVAPPSIKARIEAYKLQRASAMEAQLTVPKPTTALLLAETQITGIFRTPRGYAAMVAATPIKLSYVIYPGERFYDGQLVAIEDGRLVFRRERQWSDGRRETVVETKPLRRVAAADQLAAAADKMKDDKPSSSTSAAPAAAPFAPGGSGEAGPRAAGEADTRQAESSERGPGRAVPPPGGDGKPNILQLMKSEKWDEIQAQLEKCPNGKGSINIEDGTVTCRDN